MADVCNSAFLVRLSISLWTARKLDKKATSDARSRAGATEKAGVKVYKSILATEALDKVQVIASKARVEHRQRTVPWAYDGPGAITAVGYPAYKATMATLEYEFHRAVGDFYSVYAQEREAARAYLGDMFNEADYPTTGELRGKFAFHVHVEPMPVARDFRVMGLPAELVQEIKDNLDQQHGDALADANSAAWARVVETVEKLRLRLTEYQRGEVTKFYDSWRDNVEELIGLIPSINVANDLGLVRVQQRLMSLMAYTNDDLKADATFREKTIRQASDILDMIRRDREAA